MRSLPLLVLLARVLGYGPHPVHLLEALSQKVTNYNRFSVHSELGRISPEGFEDLHENQIPLKETL